MDWSKAVTESRKKCRFDGQLRISNFLLESFLRDEDEDIFMRKKS